MIVKFGHGTERPLLRRVWAATSLCVYVGLVALVPLLHAETEVLRSQPGVEQGHSTHCPTLHSDATCLAVTGFQLPELPVRSVSQFVEPEYRPVDVPAPQVLASQRFDASRPVRAPPTPSSIN